MYRNKKGQFFLIGAGKQKRKQNYNGLRTDGKLYVLKLIVKITLLKDPTSWAECKRQIIYYPRNIVEKDDDLGGC